MKRRTILIFSILLIVIGYTLTQATAIRGKAYLTPDESAADIHTFVVDDTRQVLPISSLPFEGKFGTTISSPYEAQSRGVLFSLVNVDPYGKPIYFLGFTLLCITLLSSLQRIRWQVLTGAIVLSLIYFTLRYVLRDVPPMLQSPWLYFHVTTVMTAYALFVIIAIRPDRQAHRWAVTLLAIGILLGSIWADQAWSSYWSWDPKETWALITLIIYSIPLIPHRSSLIPHPSSLIYTTYLRLALLAVLMTYFGVNYFLGGLHSYA